VALTESNYSARSQGVPAAAAGGEGGGPRRRQRCVCRTLTASARLACTCLFLWTRAAKLLQAHTAAGGRAGDDEEADEALAEHLREQAAEVRRAWGSAPFRSCCPGL